MANQPQQPTNLLPNQATNALALGLWSVPKIWASQTVVILGGGPSLTADTFYSALRFPHRLATNQAFQLDPGAEMLVWIDDQWFRKHSAAIMVHGARYKVTTVPHSPPVRGVHRVGVLPDVLPDDPHYVGGKNSGHVALSLAYHAGAERVLLLGFDMHYGHGHNWHNLHRTHAHEDRYKRIFIPEMEQAGKRLKALGVEVINCSIGSALTSFPIVPIGEIL